MTAAERQRRRRKKLAREGKAAQREAKQAMNAEKYRTRTQEPIEWTSVGQTPLLSPIEELVAQVADAMSLDGIDANEFRAAFDKRFPV